MEIIQYNNGPEGTTNTSTKNKTTIQASDNGSYQQSLYIITMARYTGREGLYSPAIDLRDGAEYTFDFYDPADGMAIKIFKSHNLSKYEKYTQYQGSKLVFVDVDDYLGCQPVKCHRSGERHVILPRELSEKLHDTDVTFIYFRGHLCAYVRDAKDGRSDWQVLPLFDQGEDGDEPDCCERTDED